ACGYYEEGCSDFKVDLRQVAFDKNAFWNEICKTRDVRFKADVSKLSAVDLGYLKLFHKWSTFLLLGRYDSDKLTNLDFTMIYYFRKGIRVHQGVALAMNFE
ncbi:hypothetical protein J0J30_22640, partial [Vibrio vulnificus]|nr:hypothetical protein [Vibrio vulnificus]